MNEKDKIKELLVKCARCGKCRSVCPVFLETENEGQVARGRIVLVQEILEGKLLTNKEVEKYLGSCLKCLKCQANCPSGVQFEKIIMYSMNQIGAPWWMKLFFRTVLLRRWLFDICLKLGSWWQFALPGRRKGKLRHLPLLFSGKRNIPSLAPKSSLKKHPEFTVAKDEEKKVAIFTGCLGNYVYPEIIDDVVRFFTSRKVSVVIPKQQLCCGAPVFSSGDAQTGKVLAEKNVKAFNNFDVDAIITVCATGGRMLKFDYKDVLGDENYFTAPVYDLSEYIVKNFELKEESNGKKLTYHDPCHLKWGQGISEEPREILKKRCDYVESPEADRCCGFGGIFSMYYYDLGKKIFDKKMEKFEKSGFDGIVTSCPGCMLQLSDQLEQQGDNRPVIHLAEVINEESVNG